MLAPSGLPPHSAASSHPAPLPAAAQAADKGAAASEPSGEAGPRKLHVSKLTRNVTAEHVSEIFSAYGTLLSCSLPLDERVQLPKGYAVVEFGSSEEAERARDYLDGGQLDGNVIQ